MIDHTLNLELKKRAVLRQQLERAMAENRHNEITPIVAEIRQSTKKISTRLNDSRNRIG